MSRREEAEDALQTADAQLSAISQQETVRWGTFIGHSKAVDTIIKDIRRLQRVDKINVLILGESGTGKELIARSIHFGGARASGPFIPVNCSAIPDELAESSFFGHVRGAFTGALNNRQGYFEMAQGGTLFLDEIGDMPVLLQAKLLRILEDGQLIPVGGGQAKQINVRIIAATNADLHVKRAGGVFRDDLYFRLAGYIFNVPPLREHKEDIASLAEHFLSRFAVEMGYKKMPLPQSTVAMLENYHFPGNVRELKNIIEHALIRSAGAPIEPHHMQMLASNAPTVEPPTDAFPSSEEKKVMAYVRKHGSINNTQCRQLLDLDYNQASYFLKKMKGAGLLVSEGERRWTSYRLA
jgi:transcriptional regulator with GAF, ATPase, and Fis domain